MFRWFPRAPEKNWPDKYEERFKQYISRFTFFYGVRDVQV